MLLSKNRKNFRIKHIGCPSTASFMIQFFSFEQNGSYHPQPGVNRYLISFTLATISSCILYVVNFDLDSVQFMKNLAFIWVSIFIASLLSLMLIKFAYFFVTKPSEEVIPCKHNQTRHKWLFYLLFLSICVGPSFQFCSSQFTSDDHTY